MLSNFSSNTGFLINIPYELCLLSAHISYKFSIVTIRISISISFYFFFNFTHFYFVFSLPLISPMFIWLLYATVIASWQAFLFIFVVIIYLFPTSRVFFSFYTFYFYLSPYVSLRSILSCVLLYYTSLGFYRQVS